MKFTYKTCLIAFLVVIVCGTGICASAASTEAKWLLVGFTKYRDGLFADMSRLSSPTQGVSSIWVKIAPSSKSKYKAMVEDYLSTVNKNNKGFAVVEFQCEVACATNLIRYPYFVYYNGKNNVIHDSADPTVPWSSINPGSLWDKLQKSVCREGK